MSGGAKREGAAAARGARVRNPTRSAARNAVERPPGKADVRAFLAANPHYLTDNPDVLAAVVPKARALGERVVDLQGVLVGRLRAENAELAARHAELLATVRANAASQARIHGVALTLLEARSFRELIEVATTDLAVRLDVDVAVLGVENGEHMARQSVSGIRVLAPGDVARLMGEDRDVVLRTGVRGRKRLYGGGAGLVRSEALLRLDASPEAPAVMLALGARDAGRFDPSQGTELLGFLACTLELCIRTWLGLSKS